MPLARTCFTTSTAGLPHGSCGCRVGRCVLRKMAIVVVAVAIQHAAAAGEGGMSGTLYWRNGDELTGTLLDANSSQVRWQADLFPKPFLLDVGKLDWLAVAGGRFFESAEGPFQFSVGTDDVLGGELVDVASETLVIRSRAHGSLSVKRAMVAGFQRVEAALNQLARLSELSTWTTLHRGRDVAEWSMTGEGGFATRVVGAELFRDLQLAETAEVDIVLRWEGKPGFLISFADPRATRLPNDVVKLETWEDDLVLQALGSSGDFKLLRGVSRGVESIRLRLVWNQRTAELTVLDADDRLLGALKGTAHSATGHTALFIQNKSTALTVARVRVSSPTIGSPDRLHEATCGIWLDSGEAIVGSVQGLDPATGTLRIELERGGTREVAMTEVARVDLNAGPEVSGPPPELRIGCRDGRQLSGVLRSFGASELLLQTSYADLPIRVAADSIRRLRFLAADTSLATGVSDIMHVGGMQLCGSLAPAGAEKRSLGWRPVGAVSASPLPQQTDVRICRAAADASTAAGWPGDRLFLRQGDVVPGRVLAVDESDVPV
ncbi:MAG: hypothetical protein FJ276_28715, partial [Planctomycetes bacterium]|nr:hypothetical protein [Planctomycetota bacterium]